MRKFLLAALLAFSIAPAIAQVPAPVPALPDSERRTTYTITGTTCACAVGFALYGTSNDYQNWVEVWLNGTRVSYNDATYGWTLTSPSGSIGNLARPITNAIITFNSVQTGTVQIVGANRPRRTAQFNESRGVTARDMNQVLTDLVAQNRETWDKTNDVTGRSLLGLPGESISTMPAAATRAGKFLYFDATGLIPQFTSGGAGTGNVVGPTSSTLGNIAFWDNTSGTLVGAAPSFRAGNPANSALYSQLANPANGYTTIYNGMQVSLGTPLLATEQFGSNVVGVQQALVGTLDIASGDTAGNAGYGVIGYARTQSATTGAVGVGGVCKQNVASANCWASNFSVANTSTLASNVGYDIGAMYGIEINATVNLKSGSVEPAYSNLFGIYLIGSGSGITNKGSGISVDRLSIVTGSKWLQAFESRPGAAVNALLVGPTAASGTSLASQLITFNAIAGGGTTLTATINEDNQGNLLLRAATNAGVILGDSGTNLLTTIPTGSGAKIQFNALNGGSAGLIQNDTSGNLSSLATGTGVTTALGINVGSAGAFVTFNGALGTPSSGTVTNLTGTASININGTVGATTQNTGQFTSLAYSTTLTGTSTNASALAVGRQGATNPVLQVDASTASVATGLKVKGAAAAGGLALSVITSGTNENLTVDAAGSGTITLGGTSTGAITLTRATTLSAALTYGGVTLSNAVTGTGNMVLSAAPTLSGNVTVSAGDLLLASNQAVRINNINSISSDGLTYVRYGPQAAVDLRFYNNASGNQQVTFFGATGNVVVGSTTDTSGSNNFWTTGNYVLGTATKTLVLKQGANGTVGTFVCTSGGTITINNTNVAISDAIIISLNTAGGTISTNPTVNAITAGTSFTAKCAASDTATYNYAIIKNAA